MPPTDKELTKILETWELRGRVTQEIIEFQKKIKEMIPPDIDCEAFVRHIMANFDVEDLKK